MELARIVIFSQDNAIVQPIADLLPDVDDVQQVTNLEDLRTIGQQADDAVLAIVVLPQGQETELLTMLQARIGQLPLLVFGLYTQPDVTLFNTLLAVRPLALLTVPLEMDTARHALAQALERTQHFVRRKRLHANLSVANRRLNQRLQEINTVYTIGQSVASSLNDVEVLERIVDAAVNLTQADEGFVLLQENDKLYLRISKSMKANVAQAFHVETRDSIARQVIRTGRPAMLHRHTPVATGYMARALLYVPLQAPGRGALGVLGVVNIAKDKAFTENRLFTLTSIADFAGIALENARLFGVAEAERSRLSAVLEHAAEAILVTDVANRLLLWSDTAAAIFNIPPAARDQPIADHIDNEALLELFVQAKQLNSVLHGEIALENERVYNTQLSSIPHVGRVAIMQDITHLKELDRLKSEFVSTVSHDLRTPLTTVQGYIELLERVGSLTDMQRTFILKALSSLNHITALIGDLLDIGRIEAGYDLEMHPLRLDEVIRQAAEAYTVYAEQRELKLYVDLPEEALWLQGNARRIRQVIENLASNAIKYNRPGGWIKIRAIHDAQHSIVQVEDNGIGIPLEEQPHIFERFYRVRNAQTEDIQGTGLGLAIVKSVIEKHKGRVWVESIPGEGSTFAFIVPTCAAPEEDEG